jgi:hypothetical protein
MAKFSVVYDACVLYPAPLRDLLMRLAATDLFKAHWTDAIHYEENHNAEFQLKNPYWGRRRVTFRLAGCSQEHGFKSDCELSPFSRIAS